MRSTRTDSPHIAKIASIIGITGVDFSFVSVGIEKPSIEFEKPETAEDD
jgi:hypothetical protein